MARYLCHRVRTDQPLTHPWIITIRETCKMLMAHYESLGHAGQQTEILDGSICLCLAVNASHNIFKVLTGYDEDDKAQYNGGTLENCLAIAAWIGDLTLVKSLHRGSDPISFFGRPSWAAAANGHITILQFLL